MTGSLTFRTAPVLLTDASHETERRSPRDATPPQEAGDRVTDSDD